MEKFKGIEEKPGQIIMDAREAVINELIDENEKLREAGAEYNRRLERLEQIVYEFTGHVNP